MRDGIITSLAMRHPFEAVPSGKRMMTLLPLLALTALLMIALNVVGLRLTTPAAPNGIVSFELANTVPQARRILESWTQAAQLRAAFSLGLDFLFLIVYSTTIGFTCVWTGKAVDVEIGFWASLGVLLGWGQWLAALLDAAENVALVITLFGSVRAPWPQIASHAALVKFALVGAGLTYVGLGAAVYVASWFRQRRGAARS